MADQNRGRGRGLALLQALKKAQMADSPSSSDDTSSESPGPSVAPSVVRHYLILTITTINNNRFTVENCEIFLGIWAAWITFSSFKVLLQ